MDIEAFDETMLTDEAYSDWEEFDSYFGNSSCACALSNNPPCVWCTHPGNPLNLMEDERAWKKDKSDPRYWVEKAKKYGDF